MILIGHNDADALAAGWHPVQEGPAGVPCRWMSQRAEIRLRAEKTDNDAAMGGLCVTISGPASIQGKTPGLSVYKGEIFLGHCANLGGEGCWNTAIIRFDNENSDCEDQEQKLTLAIENRESGAATPLAFIPHEILGNGDLRELGSLISSVRGI